MKRRFGERLRRAFDVPERGVGPEEVPPGLRDALRRREERLRDRRPEVSLPEGREVCNDAGTCYVRELRYPRTWRHGDFTLERGFAAEPGVLAGLCGTPEAARFEPSELLFLDTETTGLAGGAGTVVFMVGLGFFAGDELLVEQTFLRCFGEEPAALRHVARRMQEHPHLVTFVGKSFDRHRLAARMAVHRLRSRVLTSRHLDLYYLARRRWRGELPDVRLQTVERHRLGVHRTDDLPGSEAPRAFFDWIRDGTGAVDAVFEHNRLDVLSLVTLLGVLGGNAPGPGPSTPPGGAPPAAR